jgi:hypothetical protein
LLFVAWLIEDRTVVNEEADGVKYRVFALAVAP